MEPEDTVFVIPTYRLRDVAAAIEEYDANFWRNGHTLKMMVFDDSSIANHEKYFALLANTRTVNELYYVGPREKEEFTSFLQRKLHDKKLQSLVKNLFRPSYGGNRNCTLMWTLGKFLISSDDDMRPEALIEDSPESLTSNEICRGKLFRGGEQRGYARKSFDLLGAFNEVLGRKVSQVPSNFEKGELLVDTSMDLETNTTRDFSRENSLLLQRGKLARDAQIKVAQTFRTGTNDIDALDYVSMFLDNDGQTDPQELTDRYVLVNFRPVVTNVNWRIDCGVAAYDNRLGLPPFFPTRLRFEDYIFRLWIQQASLASAHVDAAQNHTKNNYMRNPLATEVFNEELCTLLKRKIKDSVYQRDDLCIKFHYQGEVTLQDSEEILSRIAGVHAQVLTAIKTAAKEDRRQSLQLFADSLSKAFYGFEPDFFQQNVSRIVDDVVSQIQASLELWPTLVEICYYHKDKKALPQTRVKNKRIETHD